jgi:hypothetical protein
MTKNPPVMPVGTGMDKPGLQFYGPPQKPIPPSGYGLLVVRVPVHPKVPGVYPCNSLYSTSDDVWNEKGFPLTIRENHESIIMFRVVNPVHH